MAGVTVPASGIGLLGLVFRGLLLVLLRVFLPCAQLPYGQTAATALRTAAVANPKAERVVRMIREFRLEAATPVECLLFVADLKKELDVRAITTRPSARGRGAEGKYFDSTAAGNPTETMSRAQYLMCFFEGLKATGYNRFGPFSDVLSGF